MIVRWFTCVYWTLFVYLFIYLFIFFFMHYVLVKLSKSGGPNNIYIVSVQDVFWFFVILENVEHVEYVCFRLKNHKHSTVFTVRVAHSLPLMMSAIQIFNKDKMVAVSQLIGAEQLPTKTQVSWSFGFYFFKCYCYLYF